MVGEQLTERDGSRALRVERATRGMEEEFAAELARTSPQLRASALNLVQYLAVRRHDVRELQSDLTQLGLSSLGRMEAHVTHAHGVWHLFVIAGSVTHYFAILHYVL